MTNRNRAWRRRKARLTFWKGEARQRLFAKLFHDPEAKPVPALKPHQHGKLTHVQELKLIYSLGNQLADGFESA
jgi:hypothetical protein